MDHIKVIGDRRLPIKQHVARIDQVIQILQRKVFQPEGEIGYTIKRDCEICTHLIELHISGGKGGAH
ncbi:MAG: hypothetical protein D6742_02685 [Cyanobacteria bacterium J069]|nr:MAG: hypothetical protein D6742_02685 [Cyanobacteria bacterium J069]